MQRIESDIWGWLSLPGSAIWWAVRTKRHATNSTDHLWVLWTWGFSTCIKDPVESTSSLSLGAWGKIHLGVRQAEINPAFPWSQPHECSIPEWKNPFSNPLWKKITSSREGTVFYLWPLGTCTYDIQIELLQGKDDIGRDWRSES
jgi:hypothetical protein